MERGTNLPASTGWSGSTCIRPGSRHENRSSTQLMHVYLSDQMCLVEDEFTKELRSSMATADFRQQRARCGFAVSKGAP
jgi:hypothetical protein